MLAVPMEYTALEQRPSCRLSMWCECLDELKLDRFWARGGWWVGVGESASRAGGRGGQTWFFCSRVAAVVTVQKRKKAWWVNEGGGTHVW